MTSFNKKKENLFDASVKSGLYIITCFPNQKYYIGESNNVSARLTAHKKKLRRNYHDNFALQKDFNRFGEDGFSFQKLFFGAGLEKEERLNLETLILLTIPSKSRYNVYVNWRKREEKLNPFFGKIHSKEARHAQSIAKLGKPSTFAGRTQTNKVKQLISKENSGKLNRRKALFIDLNYYESISEAAQRTGLARRLIRERCHSKEPRFQTYQWAETM